MKTKRIAVSTRTRFEVFKRDEFRCVYCGQAPPDVVLQLDHIIAVANGGTNEMCNLATACYGCNAGKRDVPLTVLPRSQAEGLKERREKIEQLKAISRLAIEQRKLEDGNFRLISNAWVTANGDDPHEFIVDSGIESSVRRFLKRLPLDEVLDAVEVTFAKMGHRRTSGDTKFHYFCGVCWRKIKHREEPQTDEGGRSGASTVTERESWSRGSTTRSCGSA